MERTTSTPPSLVLACALCALGAACAAPPPAQTPALEATPTRSSATSSVAQAYTAPPTELHVEPPPPPPPAPAPDPSDLWVGSSTVGFDIPMEEHEDVEEWRRTLSGRSRRLFSIWLARAGTYVPMMERVLGRYHLPRDLVFLSMIESGFRPEAASWAGAVGLWQFMPKTARRFGLHVGFWVDERRDPLKSTHAAALYLARLHDLYGDWLLAFAAYNAGPGILNRALERERGDGFWDLSRSRYLRRETKQYVPKLLAAAQVSKELKRYGFNPVPYNPQLSWESLRVSRATALSTIAEACLSAEADPQLGRAAPLLAGPPPEVLSLTGALLTASVQPAAANPQRIPAVDEAPSIPPLAALEPPSATPPEHDPAPLDLDILTALNPELRAGVTPPGQGYAVHLPIGWAETCGRGLAAIPAKKRMDYRYHELKPRDRLATLARRYHTSKRAILSFNKVKARQLLNQEEIIIPIPATAADKVPIVRPEPERKRLPVYAPDQEQVLLYRVRSGDSLWKIAHRFHISVRKLRRDNRLRSIRLQIGQPLRISLGRR